MLAKAYPTTHTAPMSSEHIPYRITDKIGPTSDPQSPAQLRAFLNKMTVIPQRDHTFLVHSENLAEPVTVNLKTGTCECTAGDKQESYTCQHLHHVRYRIKHNTITVPQDWIDPVERNTSTYAKIAADSREKEAKTQRAGSVTAGPTETLVQCVDCGEHAAYETQQRLDYSVYFCSGCAPAHPSIVGVVDPATEQAELAVVRDQTKYDIIVSFITELSDGGRTAERETHAVNQSELRAVQTVSV